MSVPFKEYLQSIWKYRHLTYSLGVGDIKNRYSRNKLGIFFSLLQISLTLCVYWIIFGEILGVGAWGVPYPLFVLPGIILWNYFNGTLNAITTSLHQSENIITKLYFPRINLILSRLLFLVPDLIAGLFVFFVLMLFLDYSISITFLWTILLLPCLLFSVLGIGLWLSIISLYFRDLSGTLLQIVQFAIFVTPVFYPGTIIPENYKIFLYINPIASIIELFRSSAFDSFPFEPGYFIGIFIGIILFISGFFTFKHIEKRITDLL